MNNQFEWYLSQILHESTTYDSTRQIQLWLSSKLNFEVYFIPNVLFKQDRKLTFGI